MNNRPNTHILELMGKYFNSEKNIQHSMYANEPRLHAISHRIQSVKPEYRKLLNHNYIPTNTPTLLIAVETGANAMMYRNSGRRDLLKFFDPETKTLRILDESTGELTLYPRYNFVSYVTTELITTPYKII